ncbi:hypothetical protein GGS21DRAFT_147494 [Xylaria nigripes]|nr:hypothetical protein GGS21DRAFT_147494 [Xylaria nigripes]
MSLSTRTPKKPLNRLSSSKSFELPALNLKLGSLTEGTDIPPPLPSPKERSPPQPKPVAKKEEKVEDRLQSKKTDANGPANGNSNPLSKPDMTVVTNVNLKRAADEAPPSPVPSNRSSFRRLFGKQIRRAHNEQGSTTTQGTSIPSSYSSSTVGEEKKARRSSGWFWRLRSYDSSSNDKVAAQAEDVSKKTTGPPPPVIPELTSLRTKIDTRLGDDLFKGIGRDQ